LVASYEKILPIFNAAGYVALLYNLIIW